MNLNEAVGWLGWRREDVIQAIEAGVELPKSKQLLHLTATALKKKNEYDIAETSLDDFIEAFDKEQPGRHPPVAVRRALSVEARAKCGICGTEPPRFEFHHIIEFSQVGHYDDRHMLALCPNCHTKCSMGTIDSKEQRLHKARLQRGEEVGDPLFGVQGPDRFGWSELRTVISALGVLNNSDNRSGDSKSDLNYVELAEKNKLNRFGDADFESRKQHHEPHFHKIRAFLESPANADCAAKYYQLVDELRTKVAVRADNFSSFEEVLLHFFDAAAESKIPELRANTRTTNVLLSYMYFHCDIGKKA